MDEAAQRALEAFTSDMELIVRSHQAAKARLEDRDRDLHGKIRFHFEALAASATKTTGAEWSVQFGAMGFDLHVGATAVRVFIYKNKESSSSFRTILSDGELRIDGDYVGRCLRVETDIWDLVTMAFRAGMSGPV